MHASINGAGITIGVKAHLGIVLDHKHMVERILGAQWSRPTFLCTSACVPRLSCHERL